MNELAPAPVCACCLPQGKALPDAGQKGRLSPERIKEPALILFSLLLFIAGLVAGELLALPPLLPWLLFGAPWLLCGFSVLRAALRQIRRKDFFNEFTLMSVATLAAALLGHPAEAAGVMLFYRAGEFLQELASAGSRKSIRALLDARPLLAHVLDGPEAEGCRDLKVEDVAPEALLLVRPGEKIPLDGEVLAGFSQVDASPLTGESLPQEAGPGSIVLAGCLNGGGVLRLRARGCFADTQAARILDLAERAAARKSPTERFITSFARYYTPAVTALALLLALLPPLLTGADWKTWIYRGLVLLVISCPCALIISIPLGYFGGIGAASRQGILVKGGDVLDALLRVRTVIFDKTGTLTRGVFSLDKIVPAPGVQKEELLFAAALAEGDSNHPIARSIREGVEAALGRPVPAAAAEREEIPGQGMRALLAGRRFLAGNAALLRAHGLEPPEAAAGGALVHVAEDDRCLGYITAADTLKPEAVSAVAALKARGLRTALLSGDRPENVLAAAGSLDLDAFRHSLLPTEKAAAMEELEEPGRAAFVGDGINDAPSLALARVGIAMGGLGAEAAVEAADAVILNDNPAKVDALYAIALKVRSVVRQNMALALGVKLLVMGLGAAGLSGLWEAVFADVGVALLAVLNSLRVMRA